MKHDVGPLPARVPAKKRQVEQLADLHIAQWLDGDGLTPSERRKLEEEKARRRALVPDRVLGVLVGEEGLTPVQFGVLAMAVKRSGATAIMAPRVARLLYSTCGQVAPTQTVFAKTYDEAMKEIVRQSHFVVAGPKERFEPAKKDQGVWAMVRYAKHRSLAVTVVTPDGRVHGG